MVSRETRDDLKAVAAVFAISFVAIVMCLCLAKANRAAREECRERGGYQEEVRGGRSGWVCLGTTR